jgi:hypothetical protein
MTAIDRRAVLRDILPGALAAIGAAAVGLAITSEAAESMPIAAGDLLNAAKAEDLVANAQVVVVNPRRRRRRRRVCFWRGGRRVCTWRWVWV